MEVVDRRQVKTGPAVPCLQSARVFAGQRFGAGLVERNKEIFTHEGRQRLLPATDDLRQVACRPGEMGQTECPLSIEGQQLLADRLIGRPGSGALPRKNDGLHLLERSWAAAGTYRQMTDALRHENKVIVSLPRFKMETQFKLSSVLGDMGAQLAFGDGADFSGIANEPLKISKVIHKAFVDVNEEGTGAAAATGVVMAKAMSLASLPKVFLADHPFLFFIRHRSTNSVLFSGRLLDPT
jgi:hypothetical protein